MAHGRDDQFSVTREAADGSGDEMLGIRFQRGGERQRAVKVPAICCLHIHHAELTLSQCPCLIEDDHVNFARDFKCEAVADEDAVACAQRGGDGNDKRNCETERVRTGNNKDCILYYDSAMVIFEKIKDTLGIASVMNNKALFYEDRGEYVKALECALKNESLLSSGQNKSRYVAGLITLGNVYEKLKNYDSALVIYERTYKLSNDIGFKGYANT